MKQYKSITRDTQRLLDGMEGRDVDFKQSAEFDASDLVAFANASGGTLLLGVSEKKRQDGSEYREIVGCRADDQARLRILQRAAGCSPQIDILIQFENISKVPIIRVDVPEGRSKPYSTSGGTYKIRENGNNKPLLPSHLLSLFLESETRHFVAAFKNVGTELTDQLTSAIDSTSDRTSSRLEQLEESFTEQLHKLLTEFDSTLEHQSTLLTHQIAEVQNYVESMLETVDGSSFLMEKFADLHESLETRIAVVRSTCERMHAGILAIGNKHGVGDFDKEFWRTRVAKTMQSAWDRAAAKGMSTDDANITAVQSAFLLSRCPDDFIIIKTLCDELLPTLPGSSVCAPKDTLRKKRRKSASS